MLEVEGHPLDLLKEFLGWPHYLAVVGDAPEVHFEVGLADRGGDGGVLGFLVEERRVGIVVAWVLGVGQI